VGESAIDKVAAYVAATRGIAVDFDHVFFGLIEGGETLTSEELDLVLETGNSQSVQPGIVWNVEYWTRYGTRVVQRVLTHLQQDPD
jgi:hypothetical protein